MVGVFLTARLFASGELRSSRRESKLTAHSSKLKAQSIRCWEAGMLGGQKAFLISAESGLGFFSFFR
jgi:hypothetical protein